ncbi:MAG: hypothetical protein M0Q99_01780 [Candidatus Cloacimonetes bacterium]|nr:hypothetical protein [Candidatus Cloacimonadota bacterium]
MMNLNSALRSPFLIACSLAFLALLLSSCNLREDVLLPPNLDPKDYVISNRIQVYADHLIRSDNDDSYLYLPKESISDSLIWYGDEISFSKEEHLLQRNTLALAEGSTKLTDSYQIRVKRNYANVSFDQAEAFGAIYTDLKHSSALGTSTLISWEYLLEAEDISVYPYGKNRVFFEIDGTGTFALTELSDSMELVIEESDTEVQGLLRDAETLLRVFIPAEFTEEMGQSVIRVSDSLEQTDLQAVQSLYSGFAMQSKVFQVSCEDSGTSSQPIIIHYTENNASKRDSQWLKLHEGRIDSWSQGEDTWIMQDETLISFINGAANYMLVQPMAEENTMRISLDGSYRQIFVQDIWLDLKDLNVSGVDLEITQNPSTQSIIQDYFGQKPYEYSGQLQAYQISFLSGSESLESLPNDGWLEFGFAADLSEVSSSRLMRVYRDSSKDVISYKTHAAAYDDTHFSSAESFVYTGINSTGTYLYGNITEPNGTQQISCIKDQLYLQMDRTTISYQDSNPPCTAIRLDYEASVQGDHPWLNDLPYSLTNIKSIMQIVSLGGRSDALPQGLFLQSRVNSNMASVINFSPLASYPKFFRYNKSNTLGHNSFLFANGMISISPAYAGFLIDGSSLYESGNTRDLAMYPMMIFDDYDLEVYLSSAVSMPESTLRIQKSASLSDPYQVLQNQYDLAYLSPAYSFQMLDNPSFYSSFQPYIRIKHQSRNQDLLFSVSDDDYYRIYSYPEGEAADGWHFLNSDGHYAFFLPYDAQYAIVRDMNPHTATQISLSTGQDGHLSLYQAQIFMPNEQIGSSIDAGSLLKLEALDSVAPGINSRSAYRVSMMNPQGVSLSPNFFEQTIEAWPYLYIPVPDFAQNQTVGVFYRSPAGITRELNQVDSFSDFPDNEFIVVGNCVVAFIDNPGVFYIE